MGFQLPDDSPLQKLEETAEAIARVVASHYRALVTSGVPDELAGEITLQYAEFLTTAIHRPTPPPAQ